MVAKGEWRYEELGWFDELYVCNVWCGDELICRPDSEDASIAIANAQLIVTAVNACQKVNADNPQAVAESISDLYEALKNLLKPYAIPDDASFPDYPEYWANAVKALAKAGSR